MTVQLIYHTHSTTTDNEAGISTGWLPGTLSPLGREQAAALGRQRRDDGIAAVYTSDLARSMETASIAFEGSDIPIRTDSRLRECNYGKYNGSPAAQLPRAEHVDVPFPEGESYQDVVERTRSFLIDAVREWNGSRIVVIAHHANKVALEVILSGASLADSVASKHRWQAGWEYSVPDDLPSNG